MTTATPTAIFGPNPDTERGTAGKLDASEDGNWLCYPSGRSVILRDARVPNKCDLYSEHIKEVSVARFSPNGQWVMSGEKTGTVRMWSATHPEKMLKKETPVLGSAIYDLAWDHESKRVLVGGDGGKAAHAKALMAETGSALGEITGHQKPVICVALRPTKPSTALTGSQDFKAGFYTGPPYKFVKFPGEHTNFVQCVRFSSDGKLACSVGSDKSIKLYDGESGDSKGLLPGEKEHSGGSIYGCSFSPDGKQLLTVAGDKTCKLWDIEKQTVISSFAMGNNTEDMQVACAWAPQGAGPVSQSLRGDLSFLDVKGGKVANVVTAHTGTPAALACDFVGSKDIYIGDSKGHAVRFTYDGKGDIVKGRGHETAIYSVVAKGGKVATCGVDDTARFIEGVEFKGSATIPGEPRTLSSNLGTPGVIAFASAKKAGLLVDNRVSASIDLPFEGTCAAVSPDGKKLLVGNKDTKSVVVYNVEGDKLTKTDTVLSNLLTHPNVIAFSPNGKYVAVGDRSKEVSLWDGATFAPVVREKWVFHNSIITGLSWTQDSLYLASSSADCHVYIWNPAAVMKKTKIPFAHKMGVSGVDWSGPNEVVTCGGDNCVKKFAVELPKA